MIRRSNEILCFVLEIFMLASFIIFGFSLPLHLVFRIFATIFILAIVIALWAVIAAPKSKHRLKMPYLAIFRAILFLLAALLFYKLDYAIIATGVFVLSIVTQAISLFTDK